MQRVGQSAVFELLSDEVRTLLNFAPKPWLLLRRDGHVGWSNPVLDRLLCYEAGALAGRSVHSVFNLVPSDNLDEMWRTLSAGACWTHHMTALRADQSELNVNVRAMGWRGDTALLVAHDLLPALARMDADNAIRWRFALEGCGDGVWDWHIQEGKVWYSPQYKAMLGYGQDEFSDDLSEWERRVPDEDRDEVYRVLARHLEGSVEVHHATFRMRAKDGSYRWIEARGKVLEREAGGRPIRMIGTHRDITDFKHLAERVGEMERALTKAERHSALAELSAQLAHELSQPLSALRNMVRGASRRVDRHELTEQDMRDVCTVLTEQADELADIVTAIRALAHRQPPSLACFQVSVLLAECQQRVTRNMRTTRPIITACEPDVVVHADRMQIALVLDNLLRNAIEATSDPQIPGSIAVGCRRVDSGNVEVYVVDPGPGIKGDLPNPDTEPLPSTKPDGLGLGLSICQSLLALHAGRLRYARRHGLTEISFVLPVATP